MVVKRFIISISVLFFYALLLQAKNEVIDHGQFLCSYYYCYSKDTIKNDEKEEDLLFLSIGKNVSKCYSYYTYQSDSLQSTEDGKAKFRALFKEALKREGYMTNSFPHRRMTACVYKNYPQNMMTVTDNLMSQYYEYSDSLGVQNWVVEGDSIKIFWAITARRQPADSVVALGRHGLPWMFLLVMALGNFVVFLV